MRIVSGTHRGRVIHPPGNLRARPTTDFAKENLFNVLANLVDFEVLEVLDLFAGTGSIGYEFASRGARSVTAVEVNAVHARFIEQTAKALGFSQLRLVRANAFLYLQRCPQTFDLIFSDAPYDLQGADAVIELVFERKLLREEGMLIFEHGGKEDFSAHPHFRWTKHYGSVYFTAFG